MTATARGAAKRRLVCRGSSGLLVVLVAAALLLLVEPALRSVPVLLVAVLAGALVGRLPAVGAVRQRVAATSRVALRVGVVLVGFRLVLPDLLHVGLGGLVLAFVVVAVTYGIGDRLGRRAGLSPTLAALVAGGVAVCGASAVAAVAAGTDASDDEVAAAIGVVTLLGTAAMLLNPVLGNALGLGDATYAVWVGASVHEVAHVVAAAGARGDGVVDMAVLVKLARVVLLAPVVMVAGHWRLNAAGRRVAVPSFVLGFLLAAATRSVGLVPASLVGPLGRAATAAFVLALVAVGATLDPRRVRDAGPRPVLVGVLASVVIGLLALAGASLVA